MRSTPGWTRRCSRTGGPASSGRLEREKPKRAAAAFTSRLSTPSEYLNARNREATMRSAAKTLALRRIRLAFGYIELSLEKKLVPFAPPPTLAERVYNGFPD